ncbi:hypothetical protein GX48_04407 [Paracoccidioides brasiliensis]|nr:hypothetical protein GX48_04407 [Paracoccidioides brasiliensis]
MNPSVSGSLHGKKEKNAGEAKFVFVNLGGFAVIVERNKLASCSQSCRNRETFLQRPKDGITETPHSYRTTIKSTSVPHLLYSRGREMEPLIRPFAVIIYEGSRERDRMLLEQRRSSARFEQSKSEDKSPSRHLMGKEKVNFIHLSVTFNTVKLPLGRRNGMRETPEKRGNRALKHD